VADEPAPYPPHVKGEKYRELPFPVESPDRDEPEPVKVPRKSGGECDPLATLGMRSKPVPKSPDEYVSDWRPVE
jgi:hypothetical protein